MTRVGGGAGGNPVDAWLIAPSDASIRTVWPRATLSEAFVEFYRAVMQELRADPRRALEAVDRVSPRDIHSLPAVDAVRLHRLRAHALAVQGRFVEAEAIYELVWNRFGKLGETKEQALTGIGWINPLSQLARYEDAYRVGMWSRSRIARGDAVRRARLDANLGNILLLSGRFGEAAGSFRASRRTFLRLEYRSDAALTSQNLGLCHLWRGQIRDAQVCFRSVEDHAGRSGLGSLLLYAQAALAIADLMAGDWEGGFSKMDSVGARLEDLEDRRAAAAIHRQQAEFLASLGALKEAEPLAARAYAAYTEAGLDADAAQVAQLHARVLSALGRIVDARVRLDFARAHWLVLGGEAAVLRSDVELAGALLTHGDAVRADHILRGVVPEIVRLDRRRGGVRGRHLLAEARLRCGAPGAAARTARAAYDDATTYPARLERPWIALTLAEALSRCGKRDEALRWARRSVDRMEETYLHLGTRMLRGRVSGSRSRIYHDVVGIVLAAGGRTADRTALDLTCRARTPELIEDLLVDRVDATGPVRAAIGRLRDELLGLDDRGDAAVRRANLRREAETLERRLGDLRVVPRRTVLSARSSRRMDQWSRLVGRRRLVVFDEFADGWHAWIRGETGSVRRVHLGDGRRVLKEVWDPFRLLLEQAGSIPARRRNGFLRATIPEAQATIRELRRAFWEPLAIKGSGAVVVVPQGRLQGVPVEALADDPGSGEGTAGPAHISRIPHPALLRGDAHARSRRALLLHDRTPARRREVEQVGSLLAERGFEVRVGSTRAEMEAAGPRLGVLHVAAHGSHHAQRWTLNAIRLADGWIGLEQMRESRFRDSLIVLGSCESGLDTELPVTRMSGWLTAGIGSGAREMILSLWKIDDGAASAFAAAFYNAWAAGAAAGEAAALARRIVRAQRPHPYAWASYLVVG